MSDRIFRALLLLYSSDFREAYGDEMTRFFNDRLARARETGGELAAARLWLRTSVDVARTAIAERATRSAPGPTTGDKPMSSFLSDLRYAARRLRIEDR